MKKRLSEHLWLKVPHVDWNWVSSGLGMGPCTCTVEKLISLCLHVEQQ